MVNSLDYEPGSRPQSWILLVWAKNWQPISRLSANVLREVCYYLPRQNFIIGLLNREIAIFDIEKHSFQSAYLSMEIPSTCVFTELTPKSIIILGFNNRSVYSLSFPGLKFTRLPDIREGRLWPGIIHCGPFIYLFGGTALTYTNLDSCERFCISENAWQTLPNMLQTKSQFTPVLHEQRIYLPALKSYEFLEYLDLKTLSFETYCRLPDSFSVSVASALGGRLVVLSWNAVYSFSLRDKDERMEVHTLKHTPSVVHSRSTPLAFGREVWFMPVEKFTAVRYRIDDMDFQTFEKS